MESNGRATTPAKECGDSRMKCHCRPAAANGPASVHSEYALLAGVVIAADTTVFPDFP